MTSASNPTAAAIVLYGFPKLASSPSNSGFCQKLETYLRASPARYTHEETYPYSSPTGKLPYVKIGGEVVADSHDAIRRLISAGLARDLNSGLAAAEAAESRAWQVYVEDYLYPRIVYERWCVDSNYRVLAAELGAALPWPLSWLLPPYFRRGIAGRLPGMGVGDRGQEQVLGAIGTAVRDLEARLLAGPGSKDGFFFSGNAPTEIDVIVGGFIMNVLGCSTHNPTAAAAVLQCPRLVALTTRLTEMYFPEYESVLRLLKGE